MNQLALWKRTCRRQLGEIAFQVMSSGGSHKDVARVLSAFAYRHRKMAEAEEQRKADERPGMAGFLPGGGEV